MHTKFMEASMWNQVLVPYVNLLQRVMLWMILSFGVYKINVDGAISLYTSVVGVITINHDWQGQVMASMARSFLQQCSSFTMELLAVKEALEFCGQTGLFSREILTDCNEGVRLLQDTFTYLGAHFHLLENVKRFMFLVVIFLFLVISYTLINCLLYSTLYIVFIYIGFIISIIIVNCVVHI